MNTKLCTVGTSSKFFPGKNGSASQHTVARRTHVCVKSDLPRMQLYIIIIIIIIFYLPKTKQS